VATGDGVAVAAGDALLDRSSVGVRDSVTVGVGAIESDRDADSKVVCDGVADAVARGDGVTEAARDGVVVLPTDALLDSGAVGVGDSDSDGVRD
jgi:hypothetical protein